MAIVTDKAIIAAVGAYFKAPDIHRNLAGLCRRLPGEAQVVVAGGAIRNIIIGLIHGHAPPTPDIDIFIGGLPKGFPLDVFLKGENLAPTELKGFRWYPEGSLLPYDLCLLPDFLVIEACHLEPTVESLLTGIDFTVNAVVYDVGSKTLIENGCTSDVRKRRIEFNSRMIPDKELIAYRALLLAHKSGFDFSEQVFHFVKDRIDIDSATWMIRLVRAKQGRKTAAAIMNAYDALCHCRTYAEYLAGRCRQGRMD